MIFILYILLFKFISKSFIGKVQRNAFTSLTIDDIEIEDPTLNIIVENMGRLNVEPRDPKVDMPYH